MDETFDRNARTEVSARGDGERRANDERVDGDAQLQHLRPSLREKRRVAITDEDADDAGAAGRRGRDELAPCRLSRIMFMVAEERALGDAIFVLGRAVERGRISPAVFAKTTRGLAREWFLKKALAKKIGRGMGLVG